MIFCSRPVISRQIVCAAHPLVVHFVLVYNMRQLSLRYVQVNKCTTVQLFICSVQLYSEHHADVHIHTRNMKPVALFSSNDYHNSISVYEI